MRFSYQDFGIIFFVAVYSIINAVGWHISSSFLFFCFFFFFGFFDTLNGIFILIALVLLRLSSKGFICWIWLLLIFPSHLFLLIMLHQFWFASLARWIQDVWGELQIGLMEKRFLLLVTSLEDDFVECVDECFGDRIWSMMKKSMSGLDLFSINERKLK